MFIPNLQTGKLTWMDRMNRIIIRWTIGVGHVGELFFVHGKARALVIQSSNLPFERPHGPVAANALDLVESAFEGVFEGEELNKVGEGKPLDQSPRIRSKFGNH